MTDILLMIGDVFEACASWFTEILESAGAVTVYLALVFLFLAVRLLLGPVFGRGFYAGSDLARYVKSNRKDGA